MTITPPHLSGRALITAAMVLATAGIGLILFGTSRTAPHAQTPNQAPVATNVTTPAHPTAVPSPTTAATASPTRAAPAVATPSAGASELPPPGSGPAADPIVQRALDQAIPADLPPALTREVVALGRRVWTSAATGAGRDQWPDYFGKQPAGTAVYTHFRIQAAIARRDGPDPNRAVVHLVWAGTDPAGTYLDNRTAEVLLHQTTTDNWEPRR